MADEKIKVLTEEERVKLKERGAYSLPDNPSDRGWNPAQIKRKIADPSLMLFDHLKKTQENVNKALTQEELDRLANIEELLTQINNRYTKQESDERYVNVEGDETIKGVLYSENEMAYLIGKKGKVGIRAYAPNTTTNAGQYAISYEVDENGDKKYFANIVTLGSDGHYYSLRISQDGIEKVINDGNDNRVKKQLATEDYVNNEIHQLIKTYLTGEGAENTIDTLQEIAEWVSDDESGAVKIIEDVEKLDKRVQLIEHSKTRTKGIVLNDSLVLSNAMVDEESGTLYVAGVKIEDGTLYI